MPHPVSRKPAWPRVVLFGWWGLMFVATHVPIPASAGEPPVPDKLIHFGMFMVLGFLLSFAFRPFAAGRLRGLACCFGLIAAYAMVDELLQVPVGRTAEWLDFFADLAGGFTGIACAALIQRLCESRGVAALEPVESEE